MAIADVYDALVSERPYKKAIPHEDAVKIIIEGKGTQFDPTLIDLFEGVSERFR
jgi:putative two-component system response regulator